MVKCGKRRCGRHVARNCSRNYLRVVRCFRIADEPVFAASRTPAGRGSIVAPCCRDLSGRTGVRRVVTFDEPVVGEAEVISLEEARQERSGGLARAKPVSS